MYKTNYFEYHICYIFFRHLSLNFMLITKMVFSVTLDITLSFDQKCQLYIKVKRIQGQLRLELRREPFSHWLLVFQDEPLIDLEIKSYISTRESSQLAQIINQQIRRAIRRKQIWPNYKIRYQPFLFASKQSLPREHLTSYK